MTLLATTFDEEINDTIKEGKIMNKLSPDFTISVISRNVLISKLINTWLDEEDKELANRLCIAIMNSFLRGYNEGKIN